jgi:hypothetical protein
MNEFLNSLWNNRISLIGVMLTAVSAAIIIISVILNYFGVTFSPYQNIVIYGFFGLFLAVGLTLIPIGTWLWKRNKDGKIDTEILRIDLGSPVHRRGVVFIMAMTFLNLAVFSVVFYKLYHITESNEFCGKICHTVMQPEFTAHGRSPHSRVHCAECHIGSGAEWFVRTKIAGIRQMYGVLTGDYSRPIPSPVEGLRPARDTCEQCHWPQVHHGKTLKVYKRLDNKVEVDDPYVTAVALNIGGYSLRKNKYEGIHWHVSEFNKVEYLAVDKKRMKIQKIRVTDKRTGKVKVYVNEEIKNTNGHSEWRTMDCIDCHNRPTHIFDVPEDIVDQKLLGGCIPSDLPDIRRVSLEAIKGKYTSQEEAKTGIPAFLKNFYSENYGEIAKTKADKIKTASEYLIEIYNNNVFPKMKITFGTYPNHIGHKEEDAGCFRCHDEEHSTSDEETISQDCEQCHEVIVESEKLSKVSSRVKEILQLQ